MQTDSATAAGQLIDLAWGGVSATPHPWRCWRHWRLWAPRCQVIDSACVTCRLPGSDLPAAAVQPNAATCAGHATNQAPCSDSCRQSCILLSIAQVPTHSSQSIAKTQTTRSGRGARVPTPATRMDARPRLLQVQHAYAAVAPAHPRHWCRTSSSRTASGSRSASSQRHT